MTTRPDPWPTRSGLPSCTETGAKWPCAGRSTRSAIRRCPAWNGSSDLLATIGYIAPLLGLLGTVSGLLGVFQEMQGKGHFVETIRLAQYVKEALLTTGAGLTVSIIAVAAYNYLVGRVESIVLDMEKATAEMVYFLTRNPITLENVAGFETQAPGEQAEHADEDNA